MHNNKLGYSGFALLEFLLSMLISILLVTMLSALLLQVQKTILKCRNNIVHQQEASLFYHYFQQVIASAGINGLDVVEHPVEIQSNWPGLAKHQAANWLGGDILIVSGTNPMNSLVKHYDGNKITLEGNDPFYQKGDEVVFANVLANKKFLVHSVSHDYSYNMQYLILNSKMDMPESSKILAYQYYLDIYYIGKSPLGQPALYVLHQNGRHELFMPFIQSWKLKLLNQSKENSVVMLIHFFGGDEMVYIFRTNNVFH